MRPIIATVTIVTASVTAGLEQSFTPENVHSFALAPDFPTIIPMSHDKSKTIDVEWAPNTVGYLPPGLEVSATILQPATSTYVSIPDQVFREAAFETMRYGKADFRWVPTTDDAVIRTLMQTMRTISTTLDPTDVEHLAEPIGAAMAVRTLQILGAAHSRDTPYPGGLPSERVRLVIDYIEANISRQIRLTELAGVAVLSPFHFARAFKQSTGVAPIRYLWRRRIERAKEALRNPALQLVAIAYDCGFSSQAHFSTSFKQFTGATPSQFRAALRALVPPWLVLEMMDAALT